MTDLIDRHLVASRAAGLSELTIEARGELLWRLERDLPEGIERATTEELQEWLGHAGWQAKTRETYWCHIVAFYRWATRGRRPIFDYDPSADMPRPRVAPHLPRVATDDQLARVLANLTRPALRAVILAAGVGMRACEVARAEREHFTRQRVIIRGKGDKMRPVPVPAEVYDEVSACPSGRLVVNHDGQPVDAAWVSYTVRLALARIGEGRLSLHWFRGAYATRLRRGGADTAVIAKLLGHASVATTQRYLAMADADLDEAVARLPPLPLAGTGPAEV